MMQVPGLGAFVGALLPVRLTGGHTVTYGVWVSIDPRDLQRALAVWWQPEYAGLTLDGVLANALLPVRLGLTPFSDVRHDPDGWMSRTGARRFAYAESHWFGNPGNYQPFVLSYNDAGTGHYHIPRHEGPVEHSGGRLRAEDDYCPAPFEPLPGWLQSARGRTTVNTLTVIGAGAPRCLAGIAGVNADEVRTLRDRRAARGNRRLRGIQREIRREAAALDAEGEPTTTEPGEAPAGT
jgi:hypothetical protein